MVWINIVFLTLIAICIFICGFCIGACYELDKQIKRLKEECEQLDELHKELFKDD